MHQHQHQQQQQQHQIPMAYQQPLQYVPYDFSAQPKKKE
jgi:hypothetical protein